MQKITPFLWFDGNAEEAINFYVSIFPNSRITSTTYVQDGRPDHEGNKIMTASFQLEGQDFHALNGGPMFQFSPAISFLVDCETQEQVDSLWDKLSEGGEKQPCGWLKDRFGVTWQIIPRILGQLLSDKDPVKARRVGEAMMKMSKLDIAALKRAYEG